MGSEYDLISTDAQTRLTEFSMEVAAAFMGAPVEQWAKENGIYRSSKALRTVMPIPLSSPLYHEFKGDIKYRSLLNKSVAMSPETWQDGFAELKSIVEAPDFIGWGEQPAAIALAAESLANEIVAGLLEANGVQAFTGVAFFSNSNPVNVFDSGFGTFDNLFTGAGTDFTVENLKLAKSYFRSIKGPNGKPLGLRMTHALFPGAMEEQVKDVLEQDVLIQAIGDAFGPVNNRHKGTIKPIFSDELSDDSAWYPLALNKPGMRPWWYQDQGAPEEIISDTTSALYHTTLKVGVAYVLRSNGVLLLPQCAQYWAGTAPS